LRDDGVYLEYIQESIGFIEEYLGGTPDRQSQPRFYEETMVQDAVLRRLETLADGTGHLSAELKSRHEEVDWRRITDFRNILAHAYTDLDLDRIWQTLTDYLPALKAVIDQELG
jgi:uncharacterized protein with HEPN domain